MSKHTPGPWRVAAPPDKVCADYRDESGSMLESNWTRGGHAKTIVSCKRRSWMDEGEEFSNARLIAAAPDMLEALKEAREGILDLLLPDSMQGDGNKARLVHRIDRVIDKAEGRP